MLVRLSSAERGSPRLSERRRIRRRAGLIVFAILIILAIGAGVYGLHQSAVRISRVLVYNADASFAEYATNAMQGSYLGIIPRDSIFFFPASSIRADILAGHPDIAAVSIFRNGLTGLSIKIDTRVPIARWCSLSDDCYVFDASGFIFATTSSSQPLNPFILYEPLDVSSSPIGLTLPNADKLPSTFDFARQLDTLGSPASPETSSRGGSVTRVVVHDGEVDEYLASGTRITYMLGHEQDAFTALVSARANMNLTDGSIDYIDLRFDGKVYVKKALGARH